MKSNIMIIRFALITFAMSIGLDCAPGSKEAYNNNETRYDAGAIISDTATTLNHVFKLRNNQINKLHIKEVTKSCTCTSASISKTMLDPGEEAELTIQIDTRPILNNWVINCRVTTDHPVQPELDFYISYRSYPHIKFGEDSVQFGDLVSSGQDPKQVARECSVELYETAGSSTDSLADVQGQPPIVAAFEPHPEVELLEGGKVRRSVYRVSATLSQGRVAASGTQVATLEAKTQLGHRASVTATWSELLPIKIFPSRLSFGIVENTSDQQSRIITIRSYDNKIFRIVGFDDGSKMLECKEEPGSSNSSEHHIKVLLMGYKADRRFVAGKLTIKTDYPGVAEVQVPWSVIIKETSAPTTGSAPPGRSGSNDTGN